MCTWLVVSQTLEKSTEAFLRFVFIIINNIMDRNLFFKTQDLSTLLLSRILKMLILLWKFVHCVCLKGHSQQYISKATSYFILHAHCTFSRLTAQSAYFTHKLQLHLLGTKKHKYINKGPIVYYINGSWQISIKT